MQKKPSKRYWRAYDSLFGDSQKSPHGDDLQLPATKVVEKTYRGSMGKSEAQEQAILVTWLERQNILHYAIPNGGRRSMGEAMQLKRTGLKPGVPDLCIPMASRGFHALYIELKRADGGVVSEAQRYWIDELSRAGNQAMVCHGADEAIAAVKHYLGR